MNWTHVCGAIRVTDNSNHEFLESKIFECFGNDSWGVKYNCLYTGHQKGIEDTLHTGMICIWGDVQNDKTYEDIYNWITKSIDRLKESNFSIEDVAIKISIQFGDTFLLTKNNDKIIMRSM